MGFNVLQEDLDVQQYAFVEASAGTGKTFAIEHLVARLVMVGIPIGRILIMTFTNAAQAELSRRIHQRLLTCLQENEGEKKRLLQAALQAFYEARITTIHKFCQSLLCQYAFEAEISLTFFEEQTQERRLEMIHHFLLSDFLKKNISSMQLKIALNDCRGKIEALMENIAQRGSGAAFDFRGFCTSLDQCLVAIGPVDKEKYLEDFEGLKGCYNKMNGCRSQAERIVSWLEAGHAPASEIEEFLGGGPFFWDLVCEENRNKRKKDTARLHYPDHPKWLQEKLTPLLEAARNPSLILNAMAYGYQQYKISFGERVESPDDLLHAMYKALEKPKFFEQVRGAFDAAIIDEFQDTDGLQWSIFEKLFLQGRPLKALYLVGDPKQSIYAFRKADLYSYLRARDAFTFDERKHLAVNYRSEKSLVDTLNVLFSQPGWMPLPKNRSALEIPVVMSAEKAEEDSLGAREKEGRRGSVHFLLIEAQSNQKGTLPIEEIQEKQIVPFIEKEIRHLLKMELFLPSRIALLVKDRRQADHLIAELKIRGMSAVFIRSEGITVSPVFSTILALLRALNDLRKMESLQRFLLSPLMNWLPEEMAAAQAEGHFPEFVNLLYQLKECYETQGLSCCLQKAFRMQFGMGTLFERLFSGQDSTLYQDYLQIQELLLEEICRGERSLAQLVMFLEEMRLKDPDEYKPLQRRVEESATAITVMTMHASKGLEFDVVFAVGLALRTPYEDGDDAEERDAEKMRLLYVAKTRAKRRLYVPLIIDKKQAPFKPGRASPIELFCARLDQSIDSYSEWLKAGASVTLEKICENLQRLTKQASLTWDILSEGSTDHEKQDDRKALVLPMPMKFLPFWKKEEIVSFSSLFHKPKPSVSENLSLEAGELPLGSDTGNIVHMFMEEILRKEWHHPLAEDKIRRLVEETIIDTKFADYGKPLLHMILSSLQLPIIPLQSGYTPFSLTDVPRSSLMPEMEFCYWYETELRKGFMDLCFVHQGLYYLVDWKTNWLISYDEKRRDETMQQQGYRLQAALYADALQRYVKLFDIRPFDTCFGGAHYLFMRGARWESFLPEKLHSSSFT